MKKDVNTVNETSSASNSYERSIIVNGHKVKGLIDTGSGCTLIRATVVARYSMTVRITSNRILKGFAGQVATSNQTTRCEIRVMDAVARVDAIVIQDDHLMYDIIVGRDFLE